MPRGADPSTKPVTIRLAGGLGNQLFQYAAGRAISRRLQCELLLDVAELESSCESVTPRQSAIESFQFRGRIVRTHRKTYDLIDGVIRSLGPFSRMTDIFTHTYREADPQFESRYLRIRPGTVVQGYFQNAMYFEDVADDVMSEVTSLAHPSNWYLERETALGLAGRVGAVHIRRGDYLTGTNADFHGVLAGDYYSPSIATTCDAADLDTLWVFSDDPQGAQALDIAWPVTPTFVAPPEASAPIESLLLMSRCAAVVTANSSFSWWAGYIAAKSHGSLVVAPSPWYRDAGMATSDPCPSSWARTEHAWGGAAA